MKHKRFSDKLNLHVHRSSDNTDNTPNSTTGETKRFIHNLYIGNASLLMPDQENIHKTECITYNLNICEHEEVFLPNMAFRDKAQSCSTNKGIKY